MNLKENLANTIINQLPNDGLIGLGAGSTINILIKKLGETNCKTAFISAASSTSILMHDNHLLELPFSQVNIQSLNLVIDGADTVFLDRKIILKGLGGALTSEKMLWNHARKIQVLIDQTKLDAQSTVIVPVEILPKLVHSLPQTIKSLLGDQLHTIQLRTEPRMQMPFITDHGNYILDIKIYHQSLDFETLHKQLKLLTGVIETGIFTSDLCNKCQIFVATESGVNNLAFPDT
ncbi:MAG: ribose 5-phosphate isomerase A [Candidatus Heimdallarchaeota archaeon]|nr:ribose 5-phosphate isomerase A [Candidatus Heimdallarchaeota archaeon]